MVDGKADFEQQSAVAMAESGTPLMAIDGAEGVVGESVAGTVWNAMTQVILPASTALVLLIVAYFVSKLLARWVSAGLCRRIDDTLGIFLGRLTFYAALTVSCVTILQAVGVDVTGFAALLAATGFAIGLAFQGTLSNFSAGILLLVFRPFKVGDLVSTGGVMGKVSEIDLITTKLDTLDNRRLIIPNSAIAGNTIENITYHNHRRVDVAVGVVYAASLDATRAILESCAKAMGDKVIPGEGRGYQIVLNNLGASSVEWTVRVWAAKENFLAVKEALTGEIKGQLQLHGIEIAFPQMQLHVSERGQILQAMSEAHQTLPIPKMNSGTKDDRGSRIRPRMRGQSSEAG